jgi:quercetin dioxygenase-like cupin family protein
MRRVIWGTTIPLLFLVSAGLAQEPAASSHVMVAAADITWGPAPPALPKGAMIALLSGDPGSSGPFTVRAKLPAGYRIPPHWHPTDEHLTVLSGTVALGMGDKVDPAMMKELTAGGYAMMTSPMRHYLEAKTEVILQVNGTGPFIVNYVNPADDPRQPPPAK